MKPALIIVDMLKETFTGRPDSHIANAALNFVPKLNRLSAVFREKSFPVVFSCDAFSPDDFLFKSGRKPHSIKGTTGAEVIDQLDQEPADLVLEKPRFSSFFRTDLDLRLKGMDVDTVAVAGITTQVCVSATLLDALSSDFFSILLEDCTAAPSEKIHQDVIGIYKGLRLDPMLCVMTADELIQRLN